MLKYIDPILEHPDEFNPSQICMFQFYKTDIINNDSSFCFKNHKRTLLLVLTSSLHMFGSQCPSNKRFTIAMLFLPAATCNAVFPSLTERKHQIWWQITMSCMWSRISLPLRTDEITIIFWRGSYCLVFSFFVVSCALFLSYCHFLF